MALIRVDQLGAFKTKLVRFDHAFHVNFPLEKKKRRCRSGIDSLIFATQKTSMYKRSRRLIHFARAQKGQKIVMDNRSRRLIHFDTAQKVILR